MGHSAQIWYFKYIFMVILCDFTNTIYNIYTFKRPRTTLSLFHMLLSCVLSSSQRFPTKSKLTEICHFIQAYVSFRLPSSAVAAVREWGRKWANVTKRDKTWRESNFNTLPCLWAFLPESLPQILSKKQTNPMIPWCFMTSFSLS